MNATAIGGDEADYLDAQILGRLATVDGRGRPHVVPTGFRLNSADGTVEIRGRNLTESKKFRDARDNPEVAFVVDDILSTDPWKVRGVEVRGRAETDGPGDAVIRIRPQKVISWGL